MQLRSHWASEVDDNNPLPEYPRPQLVRPNWLNLNGIWEASVHDLENEPSFSGFKYHQIDTIEVNQRIEFKVMENWLSYDEAKIAELNPVYKLKIIPKDNSNNTLYLPNFLIGDFLMLQDSIYHYSKKSIHSPSSSNSSSQTSYYTIKEGDTIWEIAEKHPGVSVADIKKLNSTINISNVKKGDRILIYIH